MKIPTEVTVGKNTYKVQLVNKIHTPPSLGRTHYGLKLIDLAKFDSFGTPLEEVEVDDAFWHELTHCILHDMGHDLCDNERFVTAFANRLTNAVNSAKF
jgi:predicted class III extradiol MEMO1 family dioxygenase